MKLDQCLRSKKVEGIERSNKFSVSQSIFYEFEVPLEPLTRIWGDLRLYSLLAYIGVEFEDVVGCCLRFGIWGGRKKLCGLVGALKGTSC